MREIRNKLLLQKTSELHKIFMKFVWMKKCHTERKDMSLNGKIINQLQLLKHNVKNVVA